MKSILLALAMLSNLPIQGNVYNKGPQGETRYIVVLKGGLDARLFIDNLNLDAETVFKEIGMFTILGDYETNSFMFSNPEVEFVEQDQPFVLEQMPGVIFLPSQSQEIPWGIRKVGTFKCDSSAYCRSHRAWILDTGIDLDHRDLRVNVNRGFSAFGGSPEDDHGHGTHVAGIVGAKDNNIGVVGVASGVRLVPIKVLKKGGGSTKSILAGLNHVARYARQGDIANMSLGGSVNKPLDEGVKRVAAKGIIFTLAAGNDGKNANNYSPARANGKNIYTVSAMDQNGVYAKFSNFGSAVDIAEPGVGVLSTIPNNKTGKKSGTSMAAPHAAGVLLKTGKFGGGCEKVKNDPDKNKDCIGKLPGNNEPDPCKAFQN